MINPRPWTWMEKRLAAALNRLLAASEGAEPDMLKAQEEAAGVLKLLGPMPVEDSSGIRSKTSWHGGSVTGASTNRR